MSVFPSVEGGHQPLKSPVDVSAVTVPLSAGVRLTRSTARVNTMKGAFNPLSPLSARLSPDEVLALRNPSPDNNPLTVSAQAVNTGLPPVDDDPTEVAAQVPTNPAAPRKRAIPPIVCLLEGEAKYAVFVRQLRTHLTFAPVFTRRNKEELAVQTTTDDDYRAATSFLERSNHQFYVYRNLTDRTLKVVLRNLPESLDSEDITQELQEASIPVIRTTQMRQRRTKKALPMFLVELRDCAEAKAIFDVKYVLCCKTKVEAYRGTQGPRQCHKCQRFNHVQACCSATARCVKCGEAHETSTCKKPLDAAPTCANCGQSHTANYGGCSVFRRAAASVAGKSVTAGRRPLTATNNPSANRFVPAPIPTQNRWAVLDTLEEESTVSASASDSRTPAWMMSRPPKPAKPVGQVVSPTIAARQAPNLPVNPVYQPTGSVWDPPPSSSHQGHKARQQKLQEIQERRQQQQQELQERRDQQRQQSLSEAAPVDVPTAVDFGSLITEGIALISRLTRLTDKATRQKEGLAFLAKILQALV